MISSFHFRWIKMNGEPKIFPFKICLTEDGFLDFGDIAKHKC